MAFDWDLLPANPGVSTSKYTEEGALYLVVIVVVA
jgi:hypothetical protein